MTDNNNSNKPDLVETLTNISVTAEKLAPVASRLTRFVMRCFHCMNAPQTEIELDDTTVKVRKAKNVYQVKGKCARCNHDVTGFLNTPTALKVAKERNQEIEVLPPKKKKESIEDVVEPRKTRSSKKRAASEMDVVVDEIGEPAAKENKQ